MRESISARDVVDEECTSSAAVVRASNALETFLACGIPDLKLDILLLNLDSARTKFHSNRQIVLLAEPLVRKLQQQA